MFFVVTRPASSALTIAVVVLTATVERSTSNICQSGLNSNLKSSGILADGRPYAWYFAKGVVDIRAQDNNFGKRINASLGGVQFLHDGDASAGGGVAGTNDLDDISVGADADQLI